MIVVEDQETLNIHKVGVHREENQYNGTKGMRKGMIQGKFFPKLKDLSLQIEIKYHVSVVNDIGESTIRYLTEVTRSQRQKNPLGS